MDTIPEADVHRIRIVLTLLSAGSALVHVVLCVYCVIEAVGAPAASPQRFALYHALVSAGPSVGDDLGRARAGTCAANATDVLVLHNHTLQQSWLPQRAHVHVDGFAVLAALSLVACAAQSFYLYTTLSQHALETFRQPCLVRWLELAATAPLQIALVAMCVLIRDVQTLVLLVAAEAACVLLGFCLEYALVTENLEDPLEHTFMARSPPALAVPCELRIGTIVCGPSLDQRFMCSHAERAARAWLVSSGASSLVHGAVWAVLLAQLLAVEASTCAAPPADAWLAQLRLLVATQCALCSCLALVPPLQRLWLWAGEADAAAVLLYGSVAYAVLGVVTKTILVASFASVVQLCPYA
jgi:hypothetical protein